jgi:DNA-binding protein HU-beta
MARIGKIEFIDEVSKKANLSKKDATNAVESSIAIIEAAMKKGNDVVIPGFGSFKVVKVKARKGRNVQSGEEVKIPAHKKVKFTPGKKLTETVYKKK